MRLAGRKVRPAGLVSLLLKGGDPPWRLPALHPLARGKRKTGIRAHPGARKQDPGEAERWLTMKAIDATTKRQSFARSWELANAPTA